jgi:hypothetical protein
MSSDTRINTIEANIKTNNISTISDSDLIYYLKYYTLNDKLDSVNLKKTEEYFRKINNSFLYENIFVNNTNYTSISYGIIGLVIPFYYSFPRFYKLGIFAMIIGLISFLSLNGTVNGLYSNFFSYSSTLFFILTFIIYILFFIVLNKLNHISLFFISAILAFLVINYVFRVLLTIPLESNKYNQYKATLNGNTKFTEYNLLTEIACLELIKRYKLNLPSGNMLYSYLSEFKIGSNFNKYFDFITNLIAPFISLFILFLLSFFMSQIKENGIKLFPIIGLDESSINYFICQANYILPRELNVNLLINELLEKHDFDDKIYNKLEKALLRISKELLKKYNPKFIKNDNIFNINIIKNLKDNKIFIQITKILQKYNITFKNNNNIDIKTVKEIIENEKIPFKNIEEMRDLLTHIDNALIIINENNESYNNDSELARDELLIYDKDIPKEDIPTLRDIVTEYIDNFKKNLEVNNKNNILFGYHYNIISYSLFSDKVKSYSNNIFINIVKLLSMWILFAKPVASPLLLANIIVNSKNNSKTLIKNLISDNIFWKYLTMGLDRSYFEEYSKIAKNNSTNVISKIKQYIYIIIFFIIFAPILYLYNSISFGLTSTPSWYNLLYQLVFILNIIGNINIYKLGGSLIAFNIYFLVGFILLIIFLSVTTYFISTYKK